jgi:hypothetical protein
MFVRKVMSSDQTTHEAMFSDQTTHFCGLHKEAETQKSSGPRPESTTLFRRETVLLLAMLCRFP